jgi:two-component system, NtrC family, nitrogen regulation sensor histidine kinase NtrY
VNRLRNRLILVFLAATLAPLAATWWITTSLLEHSLAYSSTERLDSLSKTLEGTGRELYQRARESLKREARTPQAVPRIYETASQTGWPGDVREFWDSREAERFALAQEGSVLEYMLRRPEGVWLYTSQFGFSMARLTDEYRQAREAIDRDRGRDLRRGLLYTFASLAAAIWLLSLTLLVYLAHRISRPIRQLTAGLAQLASGDLATRLETTRTDEIGRAIAAFNHMAAQLQQSRDRLVYLAQLASWQALARKMAHELKNSLTPIRLTMEEILARRDENDQAFIEQAARIVVEEVESLERRVRAFSEFASEPPVRRVALDVNEAVEERIGFLKTGHPELTYTLRLDGSKPVALADQDLLKGILTNLLENAADAAGAGGSVMARTSVANGEVSVEVHDSGPGLSERARKSLFEPTISFKERGMGLGLSIARKNALLSGGDILLIAGELGGAAFRVVLPEASANSYQLPDAPQRVRGAESPLPTQPSVPRPAAGAGQRR